jgi:tetratricopeptide (TPR) repeat protein
MKILYKISSVAAFFCLFVGFVQAQAERDKGIELYEKGDHQAAAEILQKVVEADKKDGEAWRFLGMAYARTKNLKQSRKAFGKAADFKDEDLNDNYDKPLKIISKRPPRYTEEARRDLISGRIKVAVEFGADGAIKYVVPIRGLSHGLTENAVKAASEIKFEPAIRNDKTVTVIKFVEYSFDIY